MKHRSKQRFSSALAILLAILLTFSALPVSAVEDNNVTIGKNSASVVTIPMDGTVGAVLTLGQGSVNKDMPVSEHIAAARQSGGTLLASVNGGLFNAYYSAGKPMSYPDNCARTYAVLIREGEAIKGSGETPMLGITSDGKALIDRVKVEVTATWRRSDSVTLWAVNDYYTDDTAVMLFTAEMGYSVPLQAGAVAVHLADGIVKSVEKGLSSVTPLAGEQLVVYNAAAWASAEQYFQEPRPGNCAEVTTRIVPRRSETAGAWSQVVTGVGCGPWLLQGGADVFSDNAEFTDPKMSRGASLARSFAAVLPDGSLMLGATTATFDAIIKYLQSIGAVDALALDGGASSMLYREGTGTLRSAGRKLSNVLSFVQYGGVLPGKAVHKEIVSISAWAQPYVDTARAKDLIPEGFDMAARENITRQEFCQLNIALLQKALGEEYAKKVYLAGISYEDARAALTDTWDLSVIDCYRLGIVSGVGGNRFDINGSITREQAAKMLSVTAGLLGLVMNTGRAAYADEAQFAGWAVEYIDQATRYGIMNGTGGGNFNPKGYFTKEQAVKTFAALAEMCGL